MAKSQRIAVAGGSGGAGRYIVNALLAVRDKYNLYIIVLSRSSSSPITIPGHTASAEVVQVDYADSAQLESVIRTHEIDTIISNLVNPDLSQFSAIQEVLLRAALNVPSFRRFVPSEHAFDSESLDPEYNFYACKLPILQTLRQLKAEHPHLEWTKFLPGAFSNYFAFGSGNEDQAMTYLVRHPVRVDPSTLKAEIPGDGERKMYFTAAEDFGSFAAEATQLDRWPEELNMVGDKKSYNEIVAILEDVLGKKFEVHYKTKEFILSVMNVPAQGWSDYVHLADLCVISGGGEQIQVSNELFPEVKPMTIREFVQKWWDYVSQRVTYLNREAVFYNDSLPSLQGSLVPRHYGVWQSDATEFAGVMRCEILEYCGRNLLKSQEWSAHKQIVLSEIKSLKPQKNSTTGASTTVSSTPLYFHVMCCGENPTKNQSSSISPSQGTLWTVLDGSHFARRKNGHGR
ncbi:hypothetical protein VNI00_002794 [Paramarasmius palmivorus]|uniref:NmrA-like domain-containing protein n=1 Tax=Paramarasmius palmivorus TaxID=297713 RepID=A0AAW0DXH1_9AGAR